MISNTLDVTFSVILAMCNDTLNVNFLIGHFYKCYKFILQYTDLGK